MFKREYPSRRLRKHPLPWWTEYLGIVLDLRFWARKTWKAYLVYIAPIIYLWFVPSTTLPPLKPEDADQHLPSPTATYAGPAVHVGSSKVSDVVSVLDSELVTVQKTPTGGSIISVPLTGTMFIAGQGVVSVTNS